MTGLGLTVTSKSNVLPVHVPSFGVNTYFTTIAALLVLVNVSVIPVANATALPLPAALLMFVTTARAQSNVAPDVPVIAPLA